jgi:hypothetical protein
MRTTGVIMAFPLDLNPGSVLLLSLRIHGKAPYIVSFADGK